MSTPCPCYYESWGKLECQFFSSASSSTEETDGEDGGSRKPDTPGEEVEFVPYKPGKTAQSRLKSTKYVVYTAGNKIVRVNLYEPDDGTKVMITRPGANNLAVDPKSLMMYYSTENDKKIVREPLAFDTPAGTVCELINNLFFSVRS